VALNKADALTPEQLKQQTARLKRAAGKAPLVVSAATGAGVREVVRALYKVIDEARHEQRSPAPLEVWHP
jgi:GTPase